MKMSNPPSEINHSNNHDDNSNSGDNLVNDDTSSVHSGVSSYRSGATSGLHGLSKEEQEVIAKQESRAIFWLRVLVVLVLVASTVGVCIAVHNHLSNAEEEDFTSQFESDAAKMIEGIADSFDNTFGAADTFALSLVSFAKSTNMTWPFVTFPDFTVQGMKVLKSSNAFMVGLYPIVEVEQIDEWKQYASEHDDWVKEALEIHANDPDYDAKLVGLDEYAVSYELYGTSGLVEEPSPLGNYSYYLPSWQDAPVIPSPFPYNLDGYHTALGPSVARSISMKRPSIGDIFQYVIFDPEDEREAMHAAACNEWVSAYIPPNENTNEPSSAIGYPIIDRVDSVRLNVDDNEDLPIVGFFHFQFYWRDMIKNLLPENSRGLILVVESECNNQSVTFQIDGEESTFLGTGDLHDPKYDYLRIDVKLTDLLSTANPDRDSDYSGLPLDEYCPKILHVFPSQQMEDQYMTNQPAVFTGIVAVIFLFTSLVFLAYDLLVAHRQKIVMKRAQASSAIVSSLFPKKVRQTLYDENEEKNKNKKEAGFKSLINAEGVGGSTTTTSKAGRPIADEFKETTIFFADLAGFTSWSSKRTPSEVFELLETIYGAFDKIAKRRGVFKVETIGDCYVAVTGLPEPQANHAIIMVKFAQECMVKMSQVTHEIMDRLGPDTADLRMRVGLHSGSVTAGVLRGDKGRFQLFGDTVNTASRMESNGVPDRIHISQATADALIVKGKSHWLIPREEKITAKGKGLMQTYFVKSTISPASITTRGGEQPKSVISHTTTASTSNSGTSSFGSCDSNSDSQS